MVRALVLVCLVAAASASAAEPYRAPRTAFGHPDLQGVWTNASLTRLEPSPPFRTAIVPEAEARAYEARHDGKPGIPADEIGHGDSEWWEMGGKLARIRGQARASWIVDPPDGRLPYTEAGRKAAAAGAPWLATFDGPEGRPTADRCLAGVGSPASPPMLNSAYNSNYQIVQTRDHVAIVVEMNHDVRIVRLEQDHAHPAVTPWMGDSVGRWEGETLVVETTNFHPTEHARGGLSGLFYTSPQGKMIERFTRIGANEILYEFTAEDPGTYARPWRAEMVFRPSRAGLFEYACHEGNYSMTNILAGARQAEAAARDASARAAPPRTAP